MVACVQVTSDVTGQEEVPLPVEEEGFSQAELDQMLAPIALYPDVLLSQVLMASTYPLEVVSASRWSRDHPDLEGNDAVLAANDENWDPSVKALVGFPDLIQLMDENLDWTRRLGDAFLLQEAQIMESIQELRHRALANGQLDDLEHINVEEQEEAIIIEPADVRVVYVPTYNTRYVYGNWWWYDYPPYCWGTWPSYHASVGFHWSIGFRVSSSYYYSDCYWPRHRVVIVKPHKHKHYHNYQDHRKHRRYYNEAPPWRHNPEHRRGVEYRNEELNAVHQRRSSSGITRTPMPQKTRVKSENVAQQRSQQPVPAGRKDVRIARENTSRTTTGPSITRTRETRTTTRPSIARDSSSKERTGPVITRSTTQQRKVDAPRPVEPNRTARIAQSKRTERVTRGTPSGTTQKTERSVRTTTTSNRKPSAGKSGTVASNNRNDRKAQADKSRSGSKPAQRESRPSRQPPPPSSDSKSNSTTQSSKSDWSNKSYASKPPTRSNNQSSNRPSSSSRPRPRDP
jgi:hypothetical protein